MNDEPRSDASGGTLSPSRTATRMSRTRRRLVEVGMALMAERGVYATRIEDITEKADIAKGAFYNYFDSKEALVAELLAGGIDLLDRDYFSGLDAASTLHDRLAALVDRHERFLDDHPEYTLLLHQSRGLLLVQRKNTEALQCVLIRYLECIGRHLLPPDTAGALSEADMKEFTAAFAGMIAGHRSFLITTGTRPDVATVREVLATGLGEAITRRIQRPG